MIEVHELRKVYAGVEPVVAVDGISFSAPRGQIFGLLGANGAGKTTTLRIIATVLQATSGRVEVDGVSVTADPQAVRARIGFLSASTGLYERLKPRELVRYFGELHGMRGAALEARIDALVADLHMESFLDRPCGVLSTGQKQKVSIARALVHDPAVLIFDEPTTGLDVVVARFLVERIAELRDARRAIVLSTHIMHEAERLCDAVAIVHHGQLRAAGTVAELREQTGTDSLEDAFFALVGGTSALEAEL